MRLPLPLAFLVSGFTVDVEKIVLNVYMEDGRGCWNIGLSNPCWNLSFNHLISMVNKVLTLKINKASKNTFN